MTLRPHPKGRLTVVSWHADPLRRAIIALVALKIVGLILIFDLTARSLQAVDLPKALFSHATAWVLVALLALSLWRHGLTIFPRSPMHAFAVAIVATQTIAALTAVDGYIALFGAPSRYLGMTFFLDLAWNIDAYGPDAQRAFLRDFYLQQFGAEHADEIASLRDEYYRLCAIRRPESSRLDAV